MPTKRNLYIIGAGDFGRELESWLTHVPEADRDWRPAGYLHSGESNLNNFPSHLSIKGNWENYCFTSSDCIVLGFTDATWKQRVYDHLAENVEIITFIHPTAIIGQFTEIGTGSVICPYCTISTNVKIGGCVSINSASNIGHDVEIGEYTSLMANVDLGGHVQIGKKVFIGTKATVIPGKKIADHVSVGVGSVVLRNIKQVCTVFGNPAKKII